MKKIFFSMFLAVFALFACGCAPKELPYSAKLFDKAENFMTETYLRENNTHYPSNNDGLPHTRCQVIKTEDDVEGIFETFPEELDFSRDMLVIYIFTDINYAFGCRLDDITVTENEMTIVIGHEMAKRDIWGRRPPSASLPTQRCLVVKLTDCSFNDVKVDLIYD